MFFPKSLYIQIEKKQKTKTKQLPPHKSLKQIKF